MSDDGENATSYDYLTYYDNSDEYAACDLGGVSAFGRVFLPTLYSLVFIIGFLGNGLVVCVLVKHRNQTNLTDICLLNLALSDLLFVLTLPLYAAFARVGEWTFGDFMCRFTAASHNTGFFSSIFFMVVMTLDRYVVIMHALTVARYRTLRAGIALTMLVWILSFSVSLPAFIYTKVTNESHGLSCQPFQESNVLKLYNLFASNVLGLLIPMLVMIACYCRIIPRLVNMRTGKKHRIVRLIVSIMIAFFVFWAPYNICIFLEFLKDQYVLGYSCLLETNVKLALTVTEAFAYTHCCLNPIIYAFVGQKFMKRAEQLLSNWLSWLHLPSRDSADSSYRKSSIMSRSSEVTPTFIK